MKIFEGRTVVLLSKHNKEEVIQPLLESATGCHFIVEKRFDTDKLGTFTREIQRKKSQLETARQKIRMACKLSNAQLAIVSEGSFGSHPMAPIPWNLEIVLLFDKKDDFEIFGIYEGSDTNFDHIVTSDYNQALDFAHKTGFPDHWLILRPNNEKGKPVFKDINRFTQFEEAFKHCVKKSSSGYVFIETDMRAHANPTRMKNIGLATQHLVEKINSRCPQCNAYGYTITEVVKGLPCEMCKWPSDLTLKYVYQCHQCKHTHQELYPKGEVAPAKYCHYCNP
jgi:hypothetical protein